MKVLLFFALALSSAVSYASECVNLSGRYVDKDQTEFEITQSGCAKIIITYHTEIGDIAFNIITNGEIHKPTGEDTVYYSAAFSSTELRHWQVYINGNDYKSRAKHGVYSLTPEKNLKSTYSGYEADGSKVEGEEISARIN